jgi:uncharacterized protein (DUF58 family)
MRPLGVALFGLILCFAAASFDAASLYVPGVAMMAIAGGAATWVTLAASGASIERHTGPHTVLEEQLYPVEIEIRSGVLPPPGGELIEPLLGWPVSVAWRWQRRVRINVRFARRGRRVLDPPRLVIRDPLNLAKRELLGQGGQEVLVLPRGGGGPPPPRGGRGRAPPPPQPPGKRGGRAPPPPNKPHKKPKTQKNPPPPQNKQDHQ